MVQGGGLPRPYHGAWVIPLTSASQKSLIGPRSGTHDHAPLQSSKAEPVRAEKSAKDKDAQSISEEAHE